MSPDNSARQIVETFLNGIGLSHAIPSFAKAGIVTPSALAELNINHYEALGVVDPDDRRKLFFLVERIKLSVPQIEDGAMEQMVAEGVSLNTSKVVARRGARDAGDNHQGIATRERTARREKVASRKTSYSPRRTRSMSSQSSSKSVSFDVDDNRRGDEYEEESTGADDEASSRHSTGARTSRRLRNRSQSTSVSGTMPHTSATHESAQEKRSAVLRKHSSLSESATMRKRSTSLGPEDTSNELTPGARKSKMPMPRNRQTETKANNPISMRTGKQLSCIPSGSIAPPSPLVTLPLSRLEADIAAQQMMEEHKAAARKTGGRRNRPHSTDSGNDSEIRRARSISDRDNDEQSSNSESRRTRRTANTHKSLDKELNTSQEVDWSRESRLKASSVGSDTITTGRSSSLRDVKGASSDTTRSSNRRSLSGIKNPSDSRLLSSSSGGYSSGTGTSNTWANQVAKLREDNQTEHDLFNADSSSVSNDDIMRIRVVIRKRPMSKAEAMAAGEMDIIHPLSYSGYGKILVYQPKTRLDLTKEVETVQFAFDNVFDETSTNVQIYQRTISNLIPGVIQGQQVSVFAYGQTGSGKSFTMLGSSLTGIVAGTAVANEKNAGLYYLAAVDLFRILHNRKFHVGVSLFEIYGKKLFDLLDDRAIVKCLEDGAGKMRFKGLSEHPIHSAETLLKLIELGAKHRSTGSTSRNADSSRSHAVLQIQVRNDGVRDGRHQNGRLTFIDLAGSERGSDTSSASQATRIESSEINSSLLCLKEVIRALATGDHVPFRGCKLTQVLKDSFVGQNSRCVMLGCISPNQNNCDHTLNTLLYCNRLKERNSETGAIPSRSLIGHKTNGTATRYKISPSETGYEAEASSALDETDDDGRRSFLHNLSDDDSAFNDELLVDDNASLDGNDSALLDNLLASSSVRSSNDSHDLTSASAQLSTGRSSQNSSALNNRKHELVAVHNTVLSGLLKILKEEMELANELSADRDGLGEHLSAIDQIQSKKVELISRLNDSLIEYRCSANAYAVQSDDSFEDLRD